MRGRRDAIGRPSGCWPPGLRRWRFILRGDSADKVAIVTRRAHHTNQVFTPSRVSKDIFIETPTVLTVKYRPDISRAASALTPMIAPVAQDY